MSWRVAGLLLLTLALTACENEPSSFRVLSWNVSDDAHVREPGIFGKVIAWESPDIILLDEVHPDSNPDALSDLFGDEHLPWNLLVGDSGGRQRQVIATRYPIRPVAEFTGIIEYPAEGRSRLRDMIPGEFHERLDLSLDGGVPVSAGLIEMNDKNLLVVAVDLQCCGEVPQSWQEQRRRVEASVIRERMTQVLRREDIDGVIYAGDFNLVNGNFVMSLLNGPLPDPVGAVIPVEVYHRDGMTTWTWDGRDTPFPDGTLDFQFFSPATLAFESGYILDTENETQDVLERLGLEKDSLARTGRHRPVLGIYAWR